MRSASLGVIALWADRGSDFWPEVLGLDLSSAGHLGGVVGSSTYRRIQRHGHYCGSALLIAAPSGGRIQCCSNKILDQGRNWFGLSPSTSG
ncbi:hypothetical protein AOLI_G00131990 [Acnodon oligacanthus]